MYQCKASLLAVLCFFSLHMFGQQAFEPELLQQLEHDIITWKAREKATDKVNSWALKTFVGSLGVGVAALVGCVASSMLCENKNIEDICFNSFGCLGFASLVSAKVSFLTWLLNFILSKYVTGMAAGLQSERNMLLKMQKYLKNEYPCDIVEGI